MSTWAGIDVGGRRKGFHVALVDERQLVHQAHLSSVTDAVEWIGRSRPLIVAIDSPRTMARPGETCRDCERRVVREVCGIRWTPDEAKVHSGDLYYEWVVHGLELYQGLVKLDVNLIECFPTASWTRWAGPRGSASRARWTRAALAGLGLVGVPERHSQDQRDAIAAAVTARAHSYRLAESIGEIVVPRGRVG